METEWKFFYMCEKEHRFPLLVDEVFRLPKKCPACENPRESKWREKRLLRQFRKELKTFRIEES